MIPTEMRLCSVFEECLSRVPCGGSEQKIHGRLLTLSNTRNCFSLRRRTLQGQVNVYARITSMLATDGFF